MSVTSGFIKFHLFYRLYGMNWTYRKVFVLTVFAVFLFWFTLLCMNRQSDFEAKSGRRPEKKVLIYAATKMFGMEITTERFLSECQSTKGFCRISSNPADLNISDAVLFYSREFSPELIPKVRKPSRPLILWEDESPTNSYLKPGPDVINWTMTYRRDADIWYPYGHFRPLKNNRTIDFDEIWNSKDSSKTAVWLASNCYAGNHRTSFVEAMQKKGLKIDRFGGCGVPVPGCGRFDKQFLQCARELIRKYKFYIAFENSNCVEYVTEKFFESLIYRMTVPIVLRRKTYIDIGAPPTSFIALDDFETLGDMIKFVNKVAADKDKYLMFHSWRTNVEAMPEKNDETGLCQLCRRLQMNSLGAKSYKDLDNWYATNQCDNEFGRQYLTN